MDNEWLNPLSVEEKEKIKGKSILSLDIPMEIPKCTHRNQLGIFTIKINEDGSATCIQCGEILYTPDEKDKKELEHLQKSMLNGFKILAKALEKMEEMRNEIQETEQ